MRIRLTTFYKTVFIGLSFCFLITACEDKAKEHQPKKPEGFFDYEAFEYDEDQKKYKREYKDNLYYTTDGLNVDSIRNLHMNQRLQRKGLRTAEVVDAGGIRGEWHERGPINEAGDMREVDFDPGTEKLYAVSTAGHLWEGKLDGSYWKVLNDKIRFSTNAFAHIKKNGNDRLIAVYGDGKQNKIPRYSDDMGQTWKLPNGIGDGFYDGWGIPKKIIESSDGKTLFYLVHTWKGNPWGSAIELYKSTDQGENYQLLLSLNGGGYEVNDADLWKPVNADVFYVMDNEKKNLYTIQYDANSTNTNVSGPISTSGLGNGELKLSGRYTNGSPTFYALTGKNTVYKMILNNGTNWQNLGQVSINGSVQDIFRNVFMANPLNNELYMGGFQFYKTSDERNWREQYSYWWTYYDKGFPLPERKNNMHVDMMDMEFFRKADNTPFFVILNHAGVYVSYDNMATTINIGQKDLNIVTLYDHATAPDGSMFFGAQDKGTFRSTRNNNADVTQISSENMTTGDGMRELFFNNGNSWFGFLQNGSMICMADKDGTRQEWWQVPGNDIPGWINPVENHPDPAAKKCYVAGGNINGGSGSYLIQMEVSWTGSGNNFQWLPQQYNYDFRANSRNGRSVIKALSASVADYNRLYVATQDASFFTSRNGGSSWERSGFTLPSSMIPWDIVVSKNDANRVFICGTGWSDTGVWMSTDGGNTFQALYNDYVQGTYFDMVLSPDESILYAASSEGPYAYVFDENKWYSISGNNTPVVDFRSVEFLESNNTVRFGTYGRGIWDFQLQDEVVVDCNGTENGEAFIDYCQQCAGGTTGNEPCQISYKQHTIPGIIELEEFDYGGKGVSYHDATEANDGGQFRPDEGVDIAGVNTGGLLLGWTVSGEWTEYTVNVTETGIYSLDYIVASPGNGNTFRLEMDGNALGYPIIFNNTGGWQQWQTLTANNLMLEEGEHILRFLIDNGAFDIDKFNFKLETVTNSSEFAFDNQLQVFPNPTNGNTVSIKTLTASSVSIFDVQGRLIQKLSGKDEYKIQTENWSSGTYLVKSVLGDKTKIEKLVVQ